MKAFVKKIIQKPWFFPLALLGIGIFAYGLIIPSLGFYWDDWEGVYLHQLHNPAISFQYYSERPLSAIAYLLLFPFAKMTPVVWQIVSLLLRWGGVLFVYYTFNLVWPSKQQQNRWVAVLLFVFPGFLEQPASVAFIQHFTTYLFFTCSLFLTVLALKQRKLFWLWMPLSILMGGLQIFMMEYFVGLEIIRPVLIWFTLQSTEKRKGLFWRALLYWSPFVIVLAAYGYWRFVYLPPTLGVDPNTPELLKTILRSPLAGLSTLAIMVYQDSLHLLLNIWPQAFLDTAKMDINSKRVWISWLCGAITCIVYGLYHNKSTKQDTEHFNDHFTVQLIFLGIVILLFGALPVWATGRQIAIGKWSERFALAPMLGAVLLIVNLIDWLFRTQKQKQILLALLLGVSVSGQMFNQFIFRDDWKIQRNIYWQLHWRIPSLQPGTALFGKGTLTDKSSYYDTIYIVNLLFDDTARQNAKYAYFDIYHAAFDDYVPGIPLEELFRGINFSGNTSQALVFDSDSHGGCVRVLDSIYDGDHSLSSSVADLFDISDVPNIKANPDSSIPQAIFGTEPVHTWCYYFEKADLARQMKDWKTILELKAEADSQGFTPNVGAEYLPFIEAFAQSGQWEQAYDLSTVANEIDPAPGAALCNAWRRFAQFDSSQEMLFYTGKGAQDFCPTGNP
jgi:hypothetical protein